LVRAVSQFVLRRIDLEAVESELAPAEHEVRYMGPADRWCVRRIADGVLVTRNLDSKEAAERHLASMVTASA